MLLDPVHSVAHFSFYRNAARKSIPATIGYLAYLGLLFSLVSTIALRMKVGPVLQETVLWAAESIPAMTLADGKLSSSLSEPTLVRHPRLPQAAFIIDTQRTAAVSPAELRDQNVAAYLTQNAVYILDNERLNVYDLAKARNPKPLVLDSKFYLQMGALLMKVLYPIAFASTWAAFLFWKHGAALFYSLLALAVNAASSAKLAYPQLYRIAVYAQTPVILLQMISLMLPRSIPFFWVLSLILAGAYLWQAIRQVSRPADEESPIAA